MFHLDLAHIVTGHTLTAADTLASGSTEASSGGVSILLLIFLGIAVVFAVRLAVAAIAPVTEKINAYKAVIWLLVILLFGAALLVST